MTQAGQRARIQGRQITLERALIHGLDRAPGQAGVGRPCGDAHMPGQLADETRITPREAVAGLDERQPFHTPVRGPDLDLTIRDREHDRAPPGRQILHVAA